MDPDAEPLQPAEHPAVAAEPEDAADAAMADQEAGNPAGGADADADDEPDQELRAIVQTILARGDRLARARLEFGGLGGAPAALPGRLARVAASLAASSTLLQLERSERPRAVNENTAPNEE